VDDTSQKPQTSLSQASPVAERLVSLDMFRGLAIAGMVFIMGAGSTRGPVYPCLSHATWNGCTAADLIFPCFLFIVGMAISISTARLGARGYPDRLLLARALRRAVVLFALGVLISNFPFYDVAALRIPGVLQRIALCYFFALLIALKARAPAQAAVTVLLLAAYWALITLVPVPGYGAGVLEPQGNLAAYVDATLLHGHLLRDGWDPEGLLSTIPALATTLLGVLTGQWLSTSGSRGQKTLGLFAAGAAAIAIGQAMGLWLPMNKSLWTSSFAVFAGGIALLLLGACYWLVDVKGYRRLAAPLVIFGVNPIALYALASLVSRLLDSYGITGSDGAVRPITAVLYERLFASWAGPLNGSLLFGAAYLALWAAPMGWLYRRRILLKI
jgi:predicted acyltransferase